MADCTGGREKEGYSVEATAAVRNRLSGLRLDSTFKSSSVVDPKNPTKTLKRRSPTQSPPVSEPNAKKEKLSLPPTPLLRRCISDTFFFNPTPPALQSPPEPTVTVTPPSPPPPAPTTNKVFASASDSAINSKPKLRRSVSDPTPRSPKTVSGSDEDDETPNSKRLARIKNRVREMSLWFQQVMLDEVEDQDDGDEEQHHQEQDENGGTSPADQHANHNTNSVSGAEDDCERKFEESVRVERLEECQVIRFRCGCGIPYDFLLAGDNCYYKLM